MLLILFLIYLLVWYNIFGESMRVISGKYKGKNLDGFGVVGTRPTMDRVKESLFGMIQNKVKNSAVLDLFAGSGALGIEALSNGAKSCYFVDSGKEIGKILQKNLVGIENSYVLLMDYQKAIEKFKNEHLQFDIIFLDPPYHIGILNKVINEIKNANILEKGSLLICEYEEEKPNIEESIFILQKEKKYGDKMIAIYKCE